MYSWAPTFSHHQQHRRQLTNLVPITFRLAASSSSSFSVLPAPGVSAPRQHQTIQQWCMQIWTGCLKVCFMRAPRELYPPPSMQISSTHTRARAWIYSFVRFHSFFFLDRLIREILRLSHLTLRTVSIITESWNETLALRGYVRPHVKINDRATTK